jgi:hypothetical protein
VHAINDWVYHHRGFSKNEHYFIAPMLGPTPVQVLEAGGDCADKSRLVAAMLNELNIRAGLVMLSPCPRCGFIHTVVEAQSENGRMVVDPVWNVDYPTATGRFLGVHDLAGTNFGQQRIAELQRQRGTTDKIAQMPASEATFDHAVAINWDKNAMTRVVAEALKFLGYSPETMFRPRFLEDPKLALLLLVGCIGIAVIAGRFLIGFGIGFIRVMAHRRITGTGGERAEPV